MGWEYRKHCGPYYTRSRREGDRVVREYFRVGEAAQNAAAEDEARRRKKRQQRHEERIELARLSEIEARMEDYYRQAAAELEASLAAAGYRQHNRGAWRKIRQPAGARKENGSMAEEKLLTAPPVTETETVAGRYTPAENEACVGEGTPAENEVRMGNMARASKNPMLSGEEDELLVRAQEGDHTTRAGTREILKRFGPRGFRPLADAVCSDILELLCGPDIVMYEDIQAQLQNLRCELAGPGSSPLEGLLAERVAVCWLHVHYSELCWSQNMGLDSTRRLEFYQRCMEGAHRRYLAAIRSLAQVRRLQLPSVQLNLANQQINVAERQINLEAPQPPAPPPI